MHTRPLAFLGSLILTLLCQDAHSQLGDLTSDRASKKVPTEIVGAGVERITFENLAAGTIPSAVFSNKGSGPIPVEGFNPALSAGANAALVFDSAAPTGEDFDLGCPNEDFGGPGVGSGGGAGSPFVNNRPQGKILIIAEDLTDTNGDGLVDDPDDADVVGSTTTFDFSKIGPITLKTITLIDVEPIEGGASVEMFDAAGTTVGEVPLISTGDNGVAVISLGPTKGVDSMVVTLNGSGGIDNLVFLPPQKPECTGVIGDFVWNDLDGDGVQDLGEPGIPGVTVNLYDDQGNLLATVLTNTVGSYFFAGLCAGDYVVEVDESTLPPGLVPSPCDVGDDLIDNDCSPAGVTLPSDDAKDRTIDFGYTQTCTGVIGDFVWNDLDHDGVQDLGEPGFPGVTVELYDDAGNLLATAVTGPTGSYKFEGLCAGTYVVVVDESTLPPGVVPTLCDVGIDTIDNDCSPETVVLPTDDALDRTIDFGYTTPCEGSAGDFVWMDTDNDGIQDAGEPGIEGVTLTLFDGTGTPIATTVTDQDGAYQFSGLCAGTYSISVDDPSLPPDLFPSPCDAGGDDTIDNDCSPAAFVLTDDDSVDPTIDFGYAPSCSGAIGNLVWYDLDCDGIQDQGEPGLQGITVLLKDLDGDVISSVTTKANGIYRFLGLCAGAYVVELDESTLPPNFVASLCDAGGDDTVDNDCSPVTVILGSNGEVDLSVDFGFKSDCDASLGDFVWNDLDADGIQDAGEPGIEGVVLELKDDQGALIATTTTDADGAYSFGGLCAGTYLVQVDETTLPPDFEASLCNVGPDDALDNDCSPVEVTLTDNHASDETLDFGYTMVCDGSLGDFVWNDLDCDGVQDPGEPGLEGVVILLKDGQGTVIASQTTGPNGSYAFLGLCAGTYTLEVDETTLPPNFVATLCDAGGDDILDNDCSPLTVVLETSDEVDSTLDFGFKSDCTATLGDFVWFDLDGDGLQGAAEPGIQGVTLVLKDAQGDVIATQTTGANGSYLFTSLCAGTYTVEVDETTLPPDLVPTLCDAGSDDALDNDCSPFTVVLDDDEHDLTVDFGYDVECTGAIGDFVWLDLDGDHLQDPGEPGIEGVVILLLDENGNVIATTTTDQDGFYLFVGLCAGTYTIDVDPDSVPDDIAPVLCGIGSDDTIDSDCKPAEVVLPDNDSLVLDVDHGYAACGECKGGVTGLTLQFQGDQAAQVTVIDKDDNVVFDGLVEPFASFSFIGVDTDNKLTNEIDIYIDGLLDAEIHTSCSQPVTPGVIYGSFQIQAATSKDNGPVCTCGECKGGVNSLTLVSQATDTVYVEVKKSEGSTNPDELYFSGFVTAGEVISFTGNNSDGKFPSTIVVLVDGALDASIHTSCSQPIGPGMTFGSFLLADATSVDNGPICELPDPGDDFCDGTKIGTLTVQYTGEDCSATSTGQDESKVSCAGDPLDADPVHVVARNDNGDRVWFDGIVSLGGEFTLDSASAGESKLENATFVDVFDVDTGALLQSVEFHTSCSQPLFAGDQFGSILLVSFTPGS
jgi:hypothetical protein